MHLHVLMKLDNLELPFYPNMHIQEGPTQTRGGGGAVTGRPHSQPEGSNTEPTCCEATVLTTAPKCLFVLQVLWFDQTVFFYGPLIH